MKSEELRRLIDELLDGTCSEADFLKLEADLHVDPEARQAYYERLKLHTGLQLEVEGRGSGSDKIVTMMPSWRADVE